MAVELKAWQTLAMEYAADLLDVPRQFHYKATEYDHRIELRVENEYGFSFISISSGIREETYVDIGIYDQQLRQRFQIVLIDSHVMVQLTTVPRILDYYRAFVADPLKELIRNNARQFILQRLKRCNKEQFLETIGDILKEEARCKSSWFTRTSHRQIRRIATRIAKIPREEFLAIWEKMTKSIKASDVLAS